MSGTAALALAPSLDALRERGFVHLPGASLRASLGLTAAELDDFAASWDRLEMDGHMADGGRYRRRRHANYAATPGVPGHRRGPHRPHYQAVAHNALNGGRDRWFAPVEDAVGESRAVHALLHFGRAAADAVQPDRAWFVELHQFRIEAAAGAPGYPTPEGVHQDGVDLVLIAMLARRNLEGGETLIADLDGTERARFTLRGRLEAVLLDDRRVTHGVSPIAPHDPALPSLRDVLVVTWKQADAGIAAGLIQA